MSNNIIINYLMEEVNIYKSILEYEIELYEINKNILILEHTMGSGSDNLTILGEKENLLTKILNTIREWWRKFINFFSKKMISDNEFISEHRDEIMKGAEKLSGVVNTFDILNISNMIGDITNPKEFEKDFSEYFKVVKMTKRELALKSLDINLDDIYSKLKAVDTILDNIDAYSQTGAMNAHVIKSNIKLFIQTINGGINDMMVVVKDAVKLSKEV